MSSFGIRREQSFSYTVVMPDCIDLYVTDGLLDMRMTYVMESVGPYEFADAVMRQVGFIKTAYSDDGGHGSVVVLRARGLTKVMPICDATPSEIVPFASGAEGLGGDPVKNGFDVFNAYEAFMWIKTVTHASSYVTCRLLYSVELDYFLCRYSDNLGSMTMMPYLVRYGYRRSKGGVFQRDWSAMSMWGASKTEDNNDKVWVIDINGTVWGSLVIILTQDVGDDVIRYITEK